MKVNNIVEVNRKAWNYATKLHQKVLKDELDKQFENKDYVFFKECEVDELKKLGVEGKSIAQLCCNNGKEVLSLMRLGAKDCTGFDISDEAIKEAIERANKNNIEASFVRCNILDIDEYYDNKFDIIYISVGTIRWIPDLDKFFRICYRLLRDNGKIYIKEMHPLTEVINDDRDIEKDPLLIVNSYFNETYFSDNNSLDYVGHTNEKGLKKYWYIYNFTDIIGGLLKNKFKLLEFEEYQDDISDVYQILESQKIRLPLSYKIIASINKK